jgi:hypothetical protein
MLSSQIKVFLLFEYNHLMKYCCFYLVELSDCSISTVPELSSNEQLVVPDEQLELNNLLHVPTQTGLMLSGMYLVEW